MTNKKDHQTTQTGDENAVVRPNVNIQIQFISDLSFENYLAQKTFSGDLTTDVAVDYKTAADRINKDNHYRFTLKSTINAKQKSTKETLFILEVEYGCITNVTNVDEKNIHPFLHIEIARLLFPFVRRLVFDIMREGSTTPINLDPPDFVEIYRSNFMSNANGKATEKNDRLS